MFTGSGWRSGWEMFGHASERVRPYVAPIALTAALAGALLGTAAPSGSSAAPGHRAVALVAAESSVEVGTVWFPAEDRGLGQDYQIATVRVSPADWLPGSRITITVETTYPQKVCVANGTPRYFGNGWLRVSFPGVSDAAADVQNVVAPTTYDGQPARQEPLAPSDGAGVGWYRDGVNAYSPALQPGTFSFSLLAPTGREHFVRPKLAMFTEYEHPTPNVPGTCFPGSAINALLATPLPVPGGTRTVASVPRVAWGATPRLNAEVSSDAGIPTGQVEVTGRGVSSSATLEQGATSAHTTLTLPSTLPVGARELTVTYRGEGAFTGSTTTTQLTVVKRKPKVALRITKAPKPHARGLAVIKVGSPLAKRPRGRVTLILRKGKARQQVRGTLNKKGKAKLPLARVPAGNWRVKAFYSGDARYATASKAMKVRVTKSRSGSKR